MSADHRKMSGRTKNNTYGEEYSRGKQGHREENKKATSGGTTGKSLRSNTSSKSGSIANARGNSVGYSNSYSDRNSKGTTTRNSIGNSKGNTAGNSKEYTKGSTKGNTNTARNTNSNSKNNSRTGLNYLQKMIEQDEKEMKSNMIGRSSATGRVSEASFDSKRVPDTERVSKEGFRSRQGKSSESRRTSKEEYQTNQGRPSFDRTRKSETVSNKSNPIRSGKSDSVRGAKKSSIGNSETTRRTVKSGACPHLRECGGCNIMRQTYEEELKEKQKTVTDLLKKYCKVETIIGMKEPNYYRNKVHVVFDHDRKGNPISGVYEEGTHRVIPIDYCLIHNQKADAIINTIRGMLKSFKIKTYDEDTEYGLLRHVLVRTGFHSGEIMVVLVLASPILPSKNNFVKALRQQHPEITTVVINVNDKRTSMVLGDKEQVIYGKGYIEDSLCEKVFRISPKSFYQVNPVQTEVIYKKAIEMAGLTGKETIIDAYCGIGTIGIIASDSAKKVIGVELNKDAVRDANTNAKRNNITNIEFYNNDAGDFMSQMAENQGIADVVFLDPPRAGSTEQFLDAVANLKPKKVVYISCNPVTLERDLAYLTKKGYKAERAVPVDMFPWTGHVETVCLLYKVK